ncbi:hypothetical protein O3Q52_51280, partial [Streptomyces sp. ActVer]|uniref:hypothetical protein n=1 Tax=Streptomyces sp. ActVer TaxID=3014558 RepID=UPI0022B5A3BF
MSRLPLADHTDTRSSLIRRSVGRVHLVRHPREIPVQPLSPNRCQTRRRTRNGPFPAADMEVLFKGIPLGDVTTSMTISGPA